MPRVERAVLSGPFEDLTTDPVRGMISATGTKTGERTMKEETKRALERAANIVDAGWCQGFHAVDAYGEGCLSNDKAAVRFCAIGAIHRAVCDEDLPPRTSRLAIVAMENALGCCAVGMWNDDERRTADEVSGMMRELAAA